MGEKLERWKYPNRTLCPGEKHIWKTKRMVAGSLSQPDGGCHVVVL